MVNRRRLLVLSALFLVAVVLSVHTLREPVVTDAPMLGCGGCRSTLTAACQHAMSRLNLVQAGGCATGVLFKQQPDGSVLCTCTCWDGTIAATSCAAHTLAFGSL